MPARHRISNATSNPSCLPIRSYQRHSSFSNMATGGDHCIPRQTNVGFKTLNAHPETYRPSVLSLLMHPSQLFWLRHQSAIYMYIYPQLQVFEPICVLFFLG